MKRKLAALVLAVAMTCSLAGCGGSGNDGSPADSGMETGTDEQKEEGTEDAGEEASGGETKNTVKIAISIDPLTLAPNGYSSDGFSTAQLYDQLWYLTNGERIMRLAESVEVEDDTHLLIKIQSGIQDIAGNEIKASDVLFSVGLAKNGTAGYPGATRYIDIDNSEVIDDTTVRLALSQPCSFQADALSMVNIVSETAYNASEDGMVTTPVGSGPYKLKEYVSGSYLVMEANEDYWAGAPAIKEVTLQFIAEESQRTNALLTGEVDLARTIAYVDVPTIDSADGLEVWIQDTLGASVLFYNCSSASACDNEELRKAIAFAINNEACKSASYGGYASNISTCTSPRFGDYREAWAELAADTGYYAYNVDKAKECLANAGVAEGTTIKLVHTGSNKQAAEAEVIQSCLKEIGLNCELVAVPDTTADLVSNQPESWDIVLWTWTNFPAQSSLATLNTFIYSNNYMHLEGAEQDSIFGKIEEAVALSDDAKKDEVMLSLYQDLYDILPVYGLYNIQTLDGKDAGLNVVSKCEGFPLFTETSWQ